jgi:hypothetical protein
MFDQLLNYEEFEQHGLKAFYDEVLRKILNLKLLRLLIKVMTTGATSQKYLFKYFEKNIFFYIFKI